MSRDISNSDDVIDSRSVIERISELQDERHDLESAVEELLQEDTPDDEDARDDLADKIEAARSDLAAWPDDELKALEALQSDAEDYSDWKHGATLIRDTYFEDYARQFAEDIGAIKDDVAWPCTCIDWKQAAEELQMDYGSVEFDGVTYWIR